MPQLLATFPKGLKVGNPVLLSADNNTGLPTLSSAFLVSTG